MIVRRIEFPCFREKNGELAVFESDLIPFPIRRVFTVSAHRGAKRGGHAHRRCAQLLVTIRGRIKLSCCDGTKAETYEMCDGLGLMVPPGIWATQEYLDDFSTIIVFCDRPYETEDYVRNYNDFLKLKAATT